ncbi:RNA polymerase sigma factor [Parapedobacter koreensis]|uniref:RNA polymerase sigma-70 factor, ECF subfamily n=1 Tax=Parapedobacter koreensis TaxID=332977 RepID=A0A1H7PUE4_9SPHI|nr:RNA polymerase sigma-70 factor [Parapedobacter koreensis]SEL39088.1 RNA polymerase sigma-70 factor, ECF subfamily [Parapedobacter koreensis]
MSFVDSSTIRRLMAGDEAAFRLIYELHSEQVYQLAFRFLKDAAWSEEIVQDVFLKLWLNRNGLDEQGNMWRYLYVIAKRLCLNKLREIRKSAILFDQLIQGMEAAKDEVEEQLMAEELEGYAQQLIASLPKQQQLIFKLSRVDGLSHKEIAVQLGLSPNTVKNHMVQALKRLKLALHQSGHVYFLALIFSILMRK